MCTVLFMPKQNGFCLASLRDESPKRPKALLPAVYSLNGSRFVMPKDEFGGGSWIGVNEKSNVIVLLNGGYVKHDRKSVYANSRGVVVFELLRSAIPVVDWQLMDLLNIEPFTLIVLSENNLFQLVWDGNEKHRTRLDSNVPHIWSSSTLYDNDSRLKREELFRNWIAMDPPTNKLAVLDFFKSNSKNEEGFLINRNEVVKTLSYSFIELTSSINASFDYYDLQSFIHNSVVIELSEEKNKCAI